MKLDSLFEPETVAIIGASTRSGKVGRSVMRNFKEGDFQGRIYPVNPNTDEVMGLRSYGSVLDIEREVDLAIISVPPKYSNDAVRECVEKGVDSVIVITSGYREIGEKGEKRSEELKDIIENSDTRLLGPNCIGVFDAYSGVDTLFVPSYKLERPDPGNIAIITQSGALGTSMLDMLAEMEVGVSRFISYGNQADITEIEVLKWLENDDKTEAVAVYMEGVSDGKEFLETARKVTQNMPIIALKAGKYGSGKDAVTSHTGSMAGSYRVYKGAFKQAGIIEAEGLRELFDKSRALAYNDSLEGNNIAVVTNGGGPGVLTTDALEKEGFELAEFNEETKKSLREVIPDYGNVNNPLDLLGDAETKRYDEALNILERDENIDGVIVIPLLQLRPLESDVIDTIINFKDSYDKPLVVSMAGGAYTKLHMENLEENEVAAYMDPGNAASSMKALLEYGD